MHSKSNHACARLDGELGRDVVGAHSENWMHVEQARVVSCLNPPIFRDPMVDDDCSALRKHVDFEAALNNIGSLGCSEDGACSRGPFEKATLELLQSCVIGYRPASDVAELVGERWRILCKAHGGEKGSTVAEQLWNMRAFLQCSDELSKISNALTMLGWWQYAVLRTEGHTVCFGGVLE